VTFKYGKLSFVLLIVVTFAHFGTAFWQDIFITLAPTNTIFMFALFIRESNCIIYRITDCPSLEIDITTPDMDQL
jgi:hypothetical protein